MAETAQNILNKNIRVILHSPLNPLDRVQKLQTLWQEMLKPPQAIPIWIQIPTHMNQEQFNNDYPIFFQYLVDQIVPQLPAIIPKIEKKAVSKTKSVRKKQKKFRHP